MYRLSFAGAPRFQAVNIVRALLGMRYYVLTAPGGTADSAVASIDSALAGAGCGHSAAAGSGVTNAGSNSSHDFMSQFDAEVEQARQHNVCR